MSYPPSLPNDPINYQSQMPARISGMAMAAMICGILSIPCFGIGLVLGVVAIILGIISLNAINKNPGVQGGKGFALAGIITGVCGLFMTPLLIAILLPGIGYRRELANRTACAANVHGITQACVVYSGDNADCFPIYNGVTATPSAQYNLQCLYYLTTTAGGAGASTKSFLCKSDPDVSTAAVGTQFYNTSPQLYCSYGIGNPTSPSSGFPASPWWKNTVDSSQPVLADMTGGTSSGNSINHNGQGQNVAFGDCHSEWTRRTTDIGNDADINATTSYTLPYSITINPGKNAAGGSVIFR